MEHAIVLKPEVLGFLGNLPITNTLLVSWIVIGILATFSILVTRRIKLVPSGIQNFGEMVVEGGLGICEDIAGSRGKIFFPFVFTFFLYVLVSNWLGLLPGFATITYQDQPLFRGVNSDLNMTLSLAIISAVLTHLFAIKYIGIKDYLKRWVSLNPIFLFVGLLEIVSEFTKIISLSFRLFGNIFAGEVVLTTISAIFAFIVPLPFYMLEIIVGFVQAAVFMMLSLVFMSILSEKHGEENSKH